MRTGDCLAPSVTFEDELDEVDIVPCEAEWSFAVLSSFLLDAGDEYPGEPAIDEAVLTNCDFATTAPLFPTVESWALGDRTVNCLLDRASFFVPAVGECYTADLLVTSRVDCGDRHTFEVFEVSTIENATFPGERVVLQTAERSCLAAFEGYVGRDYQSSELFVSPIPPTEGTFAVLGDRSIQCYLHAERFDALTGSMRDSGR